MVPENVEPDLILRGFDFLVLLAISFAALVVEYFLALGGSTPGAFAFLERFWARSALLLLVVPILLALGASRFSRCADFSVLPILGAWRAGSLAARAALVPPVVAMAAAILQAYAAIQYGRLLKRSFGPFTHPAHPQLASIADIICSSAIEEITFRAVLFAFLVVAIGWIWETPIVRKPIPMWIANILQSLAFGAAHTSLGVGGLKALPWYLSLPLAVQTWGGLILGGLYWRYGLESAIICHITYDLIIFLAVEHAHIPLLF